MQAKPLNREIYKPVLATVPAGEGSEWRTVALVGHARVRRQMRRKPTAPPIQPVQMLQPPPVFSPPTTSLSASAFPHPTRSHGLPCCRLLRVTSSPYVELIGVPSANQESVVAASDGKG